MANSLRIATCADRRPAYSTAKPRLRQSQIDAERAWALREVREELEHRTPA